MFKKLENARQTLEARTDRSAWQRGVTAYALELLEELTESAANGYITADQLADRHEIREALLNGASDWNAYSWGGSSLIYNLVIEQPKPPQMPLEYKIKNSRFWPNSQKPGTFCLCRTL